MELSDQPYFECAAGAFLAEQLPKDFHTWNKGSQMIWLEENMWAGLNKELGGRDVYTWIQEHMICIQEFIKNQFGPKRGQVGEKWWIKVAGDPKVRCATIDRMTDNLAFFSYTFSADLDQYMLSDVTFIEKHTSQQNPNSVFDQRKDLS